MCKINSSECANNPMEFNGFLPIALQICFSLIYFRWNSDINLCKYDSQSILRRQTSAEPAQYQIVTL